MGLKACARYLTTNGITNGITNDITNGITNDSQKGSGFDSMTADRLKHKVCVAWRVLSAHGVHEVQPLKRR